MVAAPAKLLDVPVVFAKSRGFARKDLARPAFAVLPDFDKWNDYGLRLFATLLILTEGDDVELPVSIMFEGEASTARFLAAQLEERGPVIPASDVGTPFITLQKEASNYAAIVAAVGFDAAVHGLRGLRDAVLARLEDDEATLALFDTEEFHLGMTRNASQYVAMRRGRSVLQQTWRENRMGPGFADSRIL